jgi:hypothetical protein
MRAEELKGHLDALLLAALKAGPRHGYAVIEALRRLEQAGLIAGSWSVVAGRRRRCYRLTAVGWQTLVGRRPAWREFAATVSGAGGGPCPDPA